MARYGLARHVFLCRDEEYIVVLDVKQDRYFALEAAKTAALSAELPGWPVTPAEGSIPNSAIEQAAAPLVRQGWLLQLPADAKDATPTRAPTPETDLLVDTRSVGAKLGVRTVVTFLVASIFAKFVLRFWSFERVIRRVGERKAERGATGRPFDVDRARRLMDAFRRMRVFLFSSREECLHDSLAVLEFLARHELFPTWVFGVRARPFAAHCWVQHADIVLNDTFEHVSSYVPIMVV
jgi:hypothetical protein